MPNRFFKGRNLPENEFITVDLLPDVRRPRQFNVNVILIVLVAVFFTWLLIYWPLTARQNDLDKALELNNDLENALQHLSEQEEAYRLDNEIITFYGHVNQIRDLQFDFHTLDQDIQAAIRSSEPTAHFLFYQYNAATQVYTIRVSLMHYFIFEDVLIDLYELDYVIRATHGSIMSPEHTTRYEAAFRIEVDIDAFETIE